MVYDDVIIGSGLAALGTAYGLPVGRRILVVAGYATPRVEFYDSTSGIPCANLGTGGLGAFWHGVIPMRAPWPFDMNDETAFRRLFEWFYPASAAHARFGETRLFVPYRPIRPAREWIRLQERHGGRLHMQAGVAETIAAADDGWRVHIDGQAVEAGRVWLAAGALGTPAILQRSAWRAAVRDRVSDHVIVYLGQIDRRAHPHWAVPHVERGPEGVWMTYRAASEGDGVITCKPARFDYRRLDHGIEQRSAFGLPTAGVIGKLMRAGSPGLIAESLFNKFGVAPDASRLSVYAQLRVHDAYERAADRPGLSPVTAHIERRLREFRAQASWPELIPSRRPELFIRGIHLHRTVDQAGVPADGLHLVDASVLDTIGAEHHSFAVMAAAARRAMEVA